jgi:hypothetical protein
LLAIYTTRIIANVPIPQIDSTCGEKKNMRIAKSTNPIVGVPPIPTEAKPSTNNAGSIERIRTINVQMAKYFRILLIMLTIFS